MSKFTKIILVIITGLALLSISMFFLVQRTSPDISFVEKEVPRVEKIIKETKTTPKSLPSHNTENITVIFGEEKINLSVPKNTVFYDALIQARDTGNLKLVGKNYISLGFFVTEIGELRAGNGKDLLYYINGKEANVGVSSYVLKDRDIIEWKLE